jgi:hypothetical protein
MEDQSDREIIKIKSLSAVSEQGKRKGGGQE